MRTYELTGNLGEVPFSFTIPFYRRDYLWTELECARFLDDILDKLKSPITNHFMGIICFQSDKKEDFNYIVLDGQQRLTTLILFLTAVRDLSNNSELREMLTSKYIMTNGKPRIILKERNNKVFEKLLFQDDDFFAISNITEEDEQTSIYQNYNFFYNKIFEFLSKHHNYSIKDLVNALDFLKFAVVEVEDENPLEVFESLNATSNSLMESDKIKNCLLMSLSPSQQREAYEKYWIGIEEKIGEDLESFIESYLIIQNNSDFVEILQEKISYKNLYRVFKVLNCEKDAISNLENLCNFTKYYEQLKTRIGALNVIFNILQTKSAMMFCMYLLKKEDEFQENLEEAFEIYLSYILRSKVCERSNIKNAHAEYLISMTNTARDKESFMFLLSSAFLHSSGPYKFPNDKEFKSALVTNDIYLSFGSAGTKYLLYEIEKATMFRYCELPSIEKGTIEHIMPQTLTQEWEKMLKNDRYCYSQNLHTLGNLTITLFNSELSNKPFEDKCKIYKTEPYYYTKDVARNEKWGSVNIKRRAEEMAGIALNIWKGLDSENTEYEEMKYTVYDNFYLFVGQKPQIVSLLNEEREVKSWNDMCYFVYSTLYDMDEITMLRFLNDEKNDLLWDAPMGTGGRKITEGIYLTMNTGVKKILTNIKNLVEFYDRKSDMIVSDKLWFTLK